MAQLHFCDRAGSYHAPRIPAGVARNATHGRPDIFDNQAGTALGERLAEPVDATADDKAVSPAGQHCVLDREQTVGRRNVGLSSRQHLSPQRFGAAVVENSSPA